MLYYYTSNWHNFGGHTQASPGYAEGSQRADLGTIKGAGKVDVHHMSSSTYLVLV